MYYYYFSGENHISPNANSNISILEDCGFAGVLFTYSPYQEDYFIQIAKDIDLSQKIKYMVAVRAHTISPQYLRKISQSIETIMPNRLQINLISGHIKEEEKNFGGIVGSINDLSSNIDRSKYLIDYLLELDKMNKKYPWLQQSDIFVSTTNKDIFKLNIDLDNKMIVPYEQFKRGGWMEIHNSENKTLFNEHFDFTKKNIMLYISPIIRETQKEIDEINKASPITGTEYFTYEGFYSFIKVLESAGINYIMLYGGSNGEEAKNIIKAVTIIKSKDLVYNKDVISNNIEGK